MRTIDVSDIPAKAKHRLGVLDKWQTIINGLVVGKAVVLEAADLGGRDERSVQASLHLAANAVGRKIKTCIRKTPFALYVLLKDQSRRRTSGNGLAKPTPAVVAELTDAATQRVYA